MVNFRSALIAIALLPAAFIATAEEDLPFHLPTPDGWRTETIPFPLTFAPELDYQGLEELRFSPGMFDAGQDDFWTYAFVWWIAADTELDAARLGGDLATYFRGLSLAVAEQNGFEPDEPTFHAELAEIATEEAGHRVFRGHAETLDAFVTRRNIKLTVRVEIVACGEHQPVIFELSPRPPEHAVWETLSAIRRGFRCERLD